MFEPITLPFGARMLLNTVKLKPGVTFDDVELAPAEEHYAIVTYWRSFEEHERSHADQTFHSKFEALAAMCRESKEFGYEMLWQGAPE